MNNLYNTRGPASANFNQRSSFSPGATSRVWPSPDLRACSAAQASLTIRVHHSVALRAKVLVEAAGKVAAYIVGTKHHRRLSSRRVKTAQAFLTRSSPTSSKTRLATISSNCSSPRTAAALKQAMDSKSTRLQSSKTNAAPLTLRVARTQRSNLGSTISRFKIRIKT